MPTLMTITASTRPGRGGEAVADWFNTLARDHGAFGLDVVDLAELGLPFLDEPHHPRLRQYTQPHTWAWSERVDAADAFVWITPGYNYGYPATLKNAVDFLHAEWSHKPLGVVSYGGVSAGTRSVQQLKQVAGAVRLVAINDAVSIPFYSQFIAGGVLQPNETMVSAAGAMLDELARMEQALRPRRTGQTAAVGG